MSSKSRRASQSITLSGNQLDGYSGRVDLLMLKQRSWWKRLLGIGRRHDQYVPLYANAKDGKARVWRGQ